jgi:restriction endonuclease
MRIGTIKTILYLKNVPFLHRYYEIAPIIIVQPAVAYLKLATTNKFWLNTPITTIQHSKTQPRKKPAHK